MAINVIILPIVIFIGVSLVFILCFKMIKYAYVINLIMSCICLVIIFEQQFILYSWTSVILYFGCPLFLINAVFYAFLHEDDRGLDHKNRYQVHFKIKHGIFKINNVKRGVSIIGSAGSGKTESVIFNFLLHFSKNKFSGVIHDYKNFELTEMAYPLFEKNCTHQSKPTPCFVLGPP